MSKIFGYLAVFIIATFVSFFITDSLKKKDYNEVSKEHLQTQMVTPGQNNVLSTTNISREENISPSSPKQIIEESKPVNLQKVPQQEAPQQKISQTEASQPSTLPKSDSPEQDSPEVLKLRASKRVVNDNTYSFTATVNSEPEVSYRYELKKDGSVISTSMDGVFSNIPPCARYELHIVSESGEDLAKPVIITDCKDKSGPKKITLEDFQKRMLDIQDHMLDGNRNKKKTFVTDDFRVVLVNKNKEIDGDYEVYDVQDVKGMIYTYNKWKDARVVSLEYDSKGYVKLANIEAVY
ncbi:MAG: hypothetical protein J6Q60_02090 [Bacteroidaceae bacterium]|nr:hypothetical protein [Bacteroidaceae bacterium]